MSERVYAYCVGTDEVEKKRLANRMAMGQVGATEHVHWSYKVLTEAYVGIGGGIGSWTFLFRPKDEIVSYVFDFVPDKTVHGVIGGSFYWLDSGWSELEGWMGRPFSAIELDAARGTIAGGAVSAGLAGVSFKNISATQCTKELFSTLDISAGAGLSTPASVIGINGTWWFEEKVASSEMKMA